MAVRVVSICWDAAKYEISTHLKYYCGKSYDIQTLEGVISTTHMNDEWIIVK